MADLPEREVPLVHPLLDATDPVAEGDPLSDPGRGVIPVDDPPVPGRKPHRWVKGMPSPNPKGRAPRLVERAYLKCMREVVTIEHWVAITRKAVDQARNGNRYARDWLGRYLVPEPAKALDMNGDLAVTFVNDWRGSSPEREVPLVEE